MTSVSAVSRSVAVTAAVGLLGVALVGCGQGSGGSNCAATSLSVRSPAGGVAVLSCAGVVTPSHKVHLTVGQTATLEGDLAGHLSYRASGTAVRVEGVTLVAVSVGSADIVATKKDYAPLGCSSGAASCPIVTIIVSAR